MPGITYNNQRLVGEDGESVLETLLRNSVDIPFSCKEGICHACTMRRADGAVPPQAQRGLKPALRQLNYFLACQYRPKTNVAIKLPDQSALASTATVTGKRLIGSHHCILSLRFADAPVYRAGQYASLCHPDGTLRSYSVASASSSDEVELHILRMKNGKMSNWIHDHLNEGDAIPIQGPYGECVYVEGDSKTDMLMVGTGTGLAPLLGVARDALRANHEGHIHLYHGSRHWEGLYCHETLLQMNDEFSNFHYHPCLSGQGPVADTLQGRASEVALAAFSSLRNMRIYLCGKAEMVKRTQKDAYLRGADLSMIHADPFVHKELRKRPR